jgi:hypothetical protein
MVGATSRRQIVASLACSITRRSASPAASLAPRRTFSTKLHDLGVAPHVVEQILNHQSHRGQVGGTYNKSLY